MVFTLVAAVDDGGESFVLEASWVQCLYMVRAYAGTEPTGDFLVAICIFADDDPSKFAHQIMRMTETDTGNRC